MSTWEKLLVPGSREFEGDCDEELRAIRPSAIPSVRLNLPTGTGLAPPAPEPVARSLCGRNERPSNPPRIALSAIRRCACSTARFPAQGWSQWGQTQCRCRRGDSRCGGRMPRSWLAGVGGVGPSPAQTRARPSRFWHLASPRSTEREFIALCLEREARYPRSPAPGLNGLTRAHFCQGTQSAPPFPRLGAPPLESAPALNALVPLHIFPRSDCAPPRSSPPTSAPGLIGSPPRISPAGRRTAPPRLTAIGSDRSTGAEVRHVHPQERYATHAHAQ